MSDHKRKIDQEPDYIHNKRYNNSIKEIRERYPSGCPDHVISFSLDVTPEEIDDAYSDIIERIKRDLKLD